LLIDGAVVKSPCRIVGVSRVAHASGVLRSSREQSFPYAYPTIICRMKVCTGDWLSSGVFCCIGHASLLHVAGGNLKPPCVSHAVLA